MSRRLLALNLCALALCWSCETVSSKSYRYSPDLSLVVSLSRPIKIGLLDFIDDRKPFDLSDLKPANQKKIKEASALGSLWAIDRSGGMIGVSHDGENYVPLSRVLRDLAQQELQKSGVEVVLLEGDFTQYEALMKHAKEQGVEWVLIGKINKLMAKEVAADSRAKKFFRGVFFVLFIAVIAIVWIALAIASSRNGGSSPGNIPGSLFGKGSKAKKPWQNMVDISFWLCNPDRGCLWKDSFSEHESSTSAGTLFSTLLPFVMEAGLRAALKQLSKQASPIPAQSATLPTSVPAGVPKSFGL